MRWDERFFASTRGRVVALLRRSERTVSELAAALEVSDNAIRGHLASLERDGLVEQCGLRRGSGKPAHLYGLSEAAGFFFPKPYDLVLAELFSLLDDRFGSEEVESLLRGVADRIVASRSWPVAIDDRLGAILSLFEEFGGVADLDDSSGGLRISGQSCPLGDLAPAHPGICTLMESILARVLGAQVQGLCERGGRPRCLFAVGCSSGEDLGGGLGGDLDDSLIESGAAGSAAP